MDVAHGIKYFIRKGVFTHLESVEQDDAMLVSQYSSFAITYSFAVRLIFISVDFVIINPENGMSYNGTYDTVLDIVGFSVKDDSYIEDKERIMDLLRFKIFNHFKKIATDNAVVFPEGFEFSDLGTYLLEEDSSFRLDPLEFKPVPRYPMYLDLV